MLISTCPHLFQGLGGDASAPGVSNNVQRPQIQRAGILHCIAKEKKTKTLKTSLAWGGWGHTPLQGLLSTEEGRSGKTSAQRLIGPGCRKRQPLLSAWEPEPQRTVPGKGAGASRLREPVLSTQQVQRRPPTCDHGNRSQKTSKYTTPPAKERAGESRGANRQDLAE